METDEKDYIRELKKELEGQFQGEAEVMGKIKKRRDRDEYLKMKPWEVAELDWGECIEFLQVIEGEMLEIARKLDYHEGKATGLKNKRLVLKDLISLIKWRMKQQHG